MGTRHITAIVVEVVALLDLNRRKLLVPRGCVDARNGTISEDRTVRMNQQGVSIKLGRGSSSLAIQSLTRPASNDQTTLEIRQERITAHFFEQRERRGKPLQEYLISSKRASTTYPSPESESAEAIG